MPIAIIVVAQLLGTSLWFSTNSAADDLTRAWGVGPSGIGWLTNAVQLGFIVGTLSIAFTGLADRYRASRIFALSAVLGACANAGFALWANGLADGMAWRFVVGLCLAGVYPLGMKLVVSWAPQQAGAALAWLVGMLTLGTALPQGVRVLGAHLPWQMVLLVSSLLALMAAAMVMWLGDGPHLKLRDPSSPAARANVLRAFKAPALRASAFAYFGHMWELYAFWTLVPMLIRITDLPGRLGVGSVAGLSFAVIGVGALGCVLGGWMSVRIGSARVAAVALGLSACCCLVFPWVSEAPAWLLLGTLLIWGMSAVADSPQFSALSSQACPPDAVGSTLAVQNGIGFAITLVAIAMTTRVVDHVGVEVAWWLLPGPLLGLIALRPLWRPLNGSR
jgi:MFS family permease